MKTTQLPIRLLMVLALVISAVSCSTNDKSKLLIKKWVIDRVDFGLEMPVETRVQMEQMIRQSKSTSFIYFHDDYTFEASALGMKAKGVWRLNDDGTELFTMDKKTQREERIKVVELKPDLLILSAEAQGQPLELTFVPYGSAFGKTRADENSSAPSPDSLK